ncbi:PAP/OAS1 substrate-binding domain-containing protein [Lindgomyces ingoldianus]|uniref:PAP/OAS1 substrate-binding domain-containing protein n=1 Tax=Lindgomyces ingoldianus TaxID=673940 RepID=A0ACB6R252_9PLEO|nr:PAP/OAS1 substrate-binding domain-containing protein [Lindgomyces ingoldianus]KAF2473404.1 PAP/OAS1 substrate-binding domain-containing protein [Lindgomyces ingoldianus]
MDRESVPSTANLEDQLRDMILGNATVAGSPTNNTASHRGRQQQNRRGRGEFVGDRGHTAFNPPTKNRRQALNPKGPSRNRQSHQISQGLPLSSAVQLGPTILQRPANKSSPRNRPRGSLMTPNDSRQGRFHPHSQQMNQIPENPMAQVNYLDRLAAQEVPKFEITMDELEEKETFRTLLEDICKKAVASGHSGDLATISLVGFGSLASGFATPGSDMDLAIVPTWKNLTTSVSQIDIEIPRLLEKAILDSNMGARLLTKTRVPILKVCQKPTEELYKALIEEREKWYQLPDEEKYANPEPTQETRPTVKPLIEVDGDKSPQLKQRQDNNGGTKFIGNLKIDAVTSNEAQTNNPKLASFNKDTPPTATTTSPETNNENKDQRHRPERPWVREKVLGPLDFPKTGVGIQCDINFSNPLGLHNTHLLRCYSLCDPRVRPMVLFIKSWAKRRKINSSYSGTLSSYGWVLMVLHYLVNVASPPVCPNLQLLWRPPANLNMAQLEQLMQESTISGWTVRFWRNEAEIMQAARAGQLGQNQSTLGNLLRGFFQYYAVSSQGHVYGPRPPSFSWTTEVLSLRTPGGIRYKSEKGWTGARTTIMAGKEIRHRYLFAIEDPFELDHNVARTVTHNGIVAIRDEFRRAWRILSMVGKDMEPEGGLFDEVVEKIPPPSPDPKIMEQKVENMDNVAIYTNGDENEQRGKPQKVADGSV